MKFIGSTEDKQILGGINQTNNIDLKFLILYFRTYNKVLDKILGANPNNAIISNCK